MVASIRSRQIGARALATGLSMLVAGTGLGPVQAYAQAQADIQVQGAQIPLQAPEGPQSVADLAEKLLDAVVNISTSQNVKEDDQTPMPQVPEGSPFQDFFDEFFKGQEGEGGPRTVNSLGSGFVIDPAGFIVTNNHVIEG
ncbi:MAG TPA: serine protease, partial [Mycoplana sp.]|nr:serine protease [Mycoplana sp.]